MLYGIARQLEAALKAQRVPYHIVFGPEATESIGSSRERIVFEQLIDEKRDSIQAPRASRINPTSPGRRLQAARIRIYARNPVSGAKWHEHAELAERVLDHVVAELDRIVRGGKNEIAWGAGGFVTVPDEKGTPMRGAAVYEIDFTIDRSIERRTWAGDAAGEVTIGTDVTITNNADVSGANGASAEFPFGG